MAVAGKADPAAFFVGILVADAECLRLANSVLEREFGIAADCLPARPFGFTDYYERELGAHPLRAFLAYGTDFPPDRLAGRKLLTNRIEEELAARAETPFPRPVNLDPGYLAPDKLVLASAKDFSHRVYLSDGIYAEVTLQYSGGRFQSLPWTFPDYGSGEYDGFFLRMRERLMRDRRARRRHDAESA